MAFEKKTHKVEEAVLELLVRSEGRTFGFKKIRLHYEGGDVRCLNNFSSPLSADLAEISKNT